MNIACVCPLTAAGETRHPAGDTVELRQKLDFRSALTAQNAVWLLKQEDPDASSGEVLAVMTEAYLILGIESWTVTDEKGKPWPVSRDNIRAFMNEHLEAAMEVGDAADALYAAAVFLPLVAKAQRSSRPTPTDDSMSRTNGSESGNHKQSKRSSTITTLTDDTEMTSPSLAGVSSS